MIQVCSRCGTRWNVRDRRRAWCPRCNGALWAPLTDVQEAQLQWSSHPPAAPAASVGPRQAPRLAPGYRWIAVRPGPPPAPRRRRRPLGPTPHYTVMPRWTLMTRLPPSATPAKSPERPGPSTQSVHQLLDATTWVLGGAALMYALIYALLIVNRTILLHPVLAGAATWLARLAGLAAIGVVIFCAVRLTRWLIARRAMVFTRQRRPESRPGWALWAGCLVPLVNLAWAPVYVLELADREGQLTRLRKPIVVWWVLWTLASVVSIFAVATSRAQDAQGIANNTATMILAYLLGLAAVRAAAKLFEGFERRPMQRPAHHWVVIADDRAGTAADRQSRETATPAAVLESEGQEPAA